MLSFLLYIILLLITSNEIKSDELIDSKEYIEEELGFVNGIYAIQTSVGSREHRILFLVDTLRSSSSIISTSCPVLVTNGFDNLTSSTFELESIENTTVVMNNEDFIGYFAHDTVRFPHFQVNKYQFLLVDTITHTNAFKYEGFIGLGFSKRKETYLSQLKSVGIIKKKMFGMHLKPSTDNGDLHVGEIDRILINATVNENNVTYAPITYTDESDTYTEWYIHTDSLDINKTKSNYTIENPIRLLLNSATSIIKIPKTFFFTNMKTLFPKEGKCQINQDNLFHCLCENNYLKTFPSFSFHLKDAVTKKDAIIQILPGDYVFISNSIISTPESNCILHISLNYKNDYWILGTSVMNNFYLIFDQEEDRIGFYRYPEDNSKSNELLISLLTISGSLLFVITIYLLYKNCCVRSHRGNSNIRNDSFVPVNNNNNNE